MQNLTETQIDALNGWGGYPRLLAAQHLLNHAVAAVRQTRDDIASGAFAAQYRASEIEPVSDAEAAQVAEWALDAAIGEDERCRALLTDAAVTWAIHRDRLAAEVGVTTEQLDWIEQVAREYCQGEPRDFRLAPAIRKAQA